MYNIYILLCMYNIIYNNSYLINACMTDNINGLVHNNDDNNNNNIIIINNIHVGISASPVPGQQPVQ